ncbi:hypothetical protein BCR37DRAFT_389148 [Protomyces lactucae-debilis]|uniref:Extracellular membrane protein CFEM domain-containing protein n=1 Tax=Protomyces lactucae-debilis TaxID=2754530 RepID=A0A1Y2F1G4_PROLT|nr:uncharacterized protein BCR37DRAFT_389148 [Protomyces lactucae-debilis]ORY77334.1 hypothetical protein BCR37DRAFT_389148 [Protomyces lactucae-debilis]
MKLQNTILCWLFEVITMLPAVSPSYCNHLGSRHLAKDSDKNLDYNGSKCQRWQFKFQKNLAVKSVWPYVPDCETMCELDFLQALKGAIDQDTNQYTGEKKISECVGDSGTCGGLSIEDTLFSSLRSICYCKAILIPLRLHGTVDGLKCERRQLHASFASKLGGGWTTEGDPELLKKNLHCNQRKASHCNCAILDPYRKLYGLPHGKECPAEVKPPAPCAPPPRIGITTYNTTSP